MRRHASLTADGGLMLSNLSRNCPAWSQIRQSNCELFDRNHRFDKFLSILGFDALARNPQ